MAGLPTAIPYDVVRVGDGYGSVFEMLNAGSVADILKKEPDRLPECAHMMTELLKKIHATKVKPGEFPDARQTALDWADFLRDHLPQEQYRKLRQLIEAVPRDTHVVHGDCHVKNVMLQNGEPLLIDMDTLSQGHPVFEFAAIYIDYQGYGELDPREVTSFFGISHETCAELMHLIFEEYFDLKDEAAYRAILDKVRVIGYARLMRRTIRRMGHTEDGKRLAAYYMGQLAELLPRVDSLTF